MTTEQQKQTKRHLAMGVYGPIFFIGVFLIEGILRPDYNPMRHFVSSLADGPRGWVQIANFIIFGLSVIGFSFSLRKTMSTGRGSTWAPRLMALVGICLVAAGIFVTDPLQGYPPGADPSVTISGSLHNLVSLIVFVGLPATCFIVARRFAAKPADRRWALYSLLAGLTMLIFFVITAFSAESADPSLTGFYQRISIISGWTWISALAYKLSREIT
jgi:hypothetical membrane protein